MDSLIYIGTHDVTEDDHPTIPSLAAVVELPWVQDGFTPWEHRAIQHISWLHFHRPSTAYDVIGMPFLGDFDTTDALALMAMYRLDWRNRDAEEHADGFIALTKLPFFQDGITDDETTLIAALGAFRSNIGRLPDALQIETAALGTELTPGLRTSIVRDHSGNPKTIGAVRDAVEFVESTMGLPLPLDHVIIVAHDRAVGNWAGVNYGFAISIRHEYDRDVGVFVRGFPEGLIAHEVAHYFWRGNEGWIDEGIADLVQFLYSGTGVYSSRPDGCDAFKISEINHWSCNYYLGFQLFRGLHDRMGAAAFAASLRELYWLSVDGGGAGVTEVYQVFEEHSDYLDERIGE